MRTPDRGSLLTRIGRYAARRLLVAPLILFVIAWPVSLFLNIGVGLGRPGAGVVWGPGSAPGATIWELTLIRGGLLLVIGGTRTDNIYYDGPTGYMSTGWPVYLLIVDRCTGPIVWVPRIARPATWCGPYIVIPWWFALIPAAPLARLGTRPKRRSAEGLCEFCGYPRVGLPEGSACPECGEVGGSITSPSTERSPSNTSPP
jgi:hypothetical protein